MNNAPLLHIDQLSVDFVADKSVTYAVKNVSLTVNKGEIVALVGESGSGKSVTSLSILQLLPSPPAQYTSGSIFFSDQHSTIDLLKLPPSKLQQIRGNKIAMIFQEPMSSLNPVMTCGKQVAEALLAHKHISYTEAKAQTIAWFEKVKLPQPQKLYDHYPHQLSGGQKQRVMIAMAMICQPSLLICDEPTTALDVTVQKSILELIKELQLQQDMGVIFITHDLGVVRELADRAAIMYKGEIIEQNSVQEIFYHPQQPYTKALIACRPSLHTQAERLPVVSDFLEGGRRETVSPSPAVLPALQKRDETVLIQVKDISVAYPAKTSLLGKPVSYYTAVDHVSLDIFRGETLGLVGESGCGKTTLGRTLLRLIEPTEGSIFFKGQDITSFTKKQLEQFRQQVQLVFQDPYSSLNPRLTIGAAIEEPLQVFDIETSKNSRKAKVAALLEQVSLSPRYAARYPHEFSGGQRQRIVIARALALHPTFLVCDESVSALDVSVQAQVLNLLNELKRELNLTLLFISHDLAVVRYMSDRMMVMQKGKIVESGPAGEIYNHPRTEYTKQLIASIPQ